MKLRSFGRIFSLVAVLALAFALTFAVSVTANAAEAQSENTITFKNPVVTTGNCQQVRFSWNKVSAATEYRLYKDGVHVATVPNSNILRITFNLEIDVETVFTVEAIADGVTIAVNSQSFTPTHTWTESEKVDPTCSSTGTQYYVCTNGTCGATTSAELAIIPSAHNAVTDPAVAPGCLTTGLTEGSHCSLCDLVFVAQEVIPATGHTQENIPAVSPTCTETGLTAGTKCAVCDEILVAQQTIKALGHSLSYTDAKAPTCTEIGWEAYETCKRTGCGYTTYEEIPALGHTPEAAVNENITNPTCTVDGKHDEVVYCSVCDAELSRVTKIDEKLGHLDDIDLPAKEATCLDFGLTAGVRCSRCGVATITQVVIPALGHDLVHTDAQSATCTEIGWEAYDTCTRCEYTTYVEIAAKGHKEAEPVKENYVKPTCTAKGSYDDVVYCSVCDVELSRVSKSVAANGHQSSPAVQENEKKPTCTKNGSIDEVVYCSVCNARLSKTTNVLPALGHTAGAKVTENNVDATCTEDGVYDDVIYCTTCNTELSRTTNEVAAFGHSYIENPDPKVALVFEHCERCAGKGKFIKVQIPPAYKDVIIKVAIVVGCAVVVIGCITALAKPASTTPWWRRRR